MTRHNDHVRAEDLMSAYLDQRVTAEEKQFLEQHLAACADCRAQLEAIRSMVAALKAMPVVKAPRSFVLPREMAKQPKRSVFSWYPALRLATAVAAIAFAILFASDVLINRSGSSGLGLASVPAAAPAPRAITNPTEAAPAMAAAAQPTEAPAPLQAPAAAPTAAGMAAESQAPAAAGAASKAATISNTTPLSETTTMLAATQAPTATPEPTIVAALPAATSAPVANAAADQVQRPAAYNAPTPAAPALEPVRLIEIALLGLVIVFGAATLIVRRRQG